MGPGRRYGTAHGPGCSPPASVASAQPGSTARRTHARVGRSAVPPVRPAGPGDGAVRSRVDRMSESVRVDVWIWSVRLVKTRSLAAAACRGGHVRVNGERVKPAHALRTGDEVRVRQEGRERVVVVKQLIRKRVGAPVAVECYV
ncbi:RNA-binding S4 domain-containing protein, partial [Streptomyces sp. UH6]|uniref:RNA-binding S4 domain-containing protein n=1 Tax=Streptomyces sp. UH6 TaxID=2748379 RepID=UPI0035BBC396